MAGVSSSSSYKRDYLPLFRERVFEVVRNIPAGKTLGYKQVAQLAGNPRAWRAVGNILNKNYDPQIPCHRVVRSDGKIGGYNRGVDEKRKLLLLELSNNSNTNILTNGCFCISSKRIQKRRRLGRKFYTRDTLEVAKDLLGKYIVRKIGSKKLVGKIVETEAYIGPQDKASHAFGGKRTPRNEAEYLIGGHIYIYLVYGMYWQLNISTSKANKPECVLIRAIEPMSNDESKIQNSKCKMTVKNSKLLSIANGPGKLCRYLKLNKSFYGEDLTKSKRIWLEDRGVKIKPSQIKTSARIGIDYAGPYWARRKWRFFIKDTNVKIKQ